MKTFENILTELRDGILLITVNRPDKLNALNKRTIEEIGEAVSLAVADNAVRGIILTGSGNKAFIAGADISEFSSYSVAQGNQLSAAGHAVFNSVEMCPKPVIAAINGFALGGGCELAMSCHIRLASDNAKFGQPEVKLGLIPGYGGTQRLIQLIGKGKAMELLMSAEMISAEEALRLGLVNYVTSQDELLLKSIELMNKITAQSPRAIEGIVRCVAAHFKDGVDGLAFEVEEFGKCFGTNDFKEGVSAFMEKRKADFRKT
ncbi:MAG: enoyl-CoA hydratase [Bacteroidetes bacterium]|nr:MAG: enoyl-CoA hydratase [Bacteroidota bacterium]REK04681.1 MAG: enoyl-CoA hydratase [Bacteroidota bacterium]REK36156.1 MAG: enoyl-CoA hydratase [Bacteroidota bacterium]REK51473.1 MAG: enoyl-CoA hydratase [Bacteroidota bacterium]